MQPSEQRDADRQFLELSVMQVAPVPAAPAQPTRYVRELIELVIFVVLLFFLVRGVLQNFVIEGISMEPTLHQNQFILVNKLAYTHFDINAPLRLVDPSAPLKVIYPFGMPKYGDIVVFEYPNDITKDYIKRIIGLPGDEVSVRDGVVFVNGQQLAEPYLQGSPTYCQSYDLCANASVFVNQDAFFVMGDNRENSSDSREWGMLPIDRMIGQAWVVYWPSNEISLIPHFDSMPFASTR
ncbi:MAG: signal peptidase I [Chloroflexota bacterium]|jgi:signal peptidase I